MKIIITGMHRSGTSMVTGLLRICGLYIGNNLNPTKLDNPKGYFEDLEFLAINRRIFQLNSGGSGGGNKPPEKIKPLPNDLIKRMQMFVSKWPQNKIVGWKDPRACITIKIWKEFIEPEEFKVIIVKRPCSEIADSLDKRHNMNKMNGLKLCRIYYQRIEKARAEIDHIYTFYHNYFKNWRRELEIITNFIGLEIPKDTIEIENFIDIKLWHNREGMEL